MTNLGVCLNFCGKVCLNLEIYLNCYDKACLNLRIVKNLHAFVLQTLSMTIFVKIYTHKATLFEKRVKLNFLKKPSILLKSA